MRVFLTGASGVVGRRALPMLLAQGHRVTVATRPGSRRPVASHRGATAVPLDIFDVEAARRVMREHDAVINLATRIPSGTMRPFLPGAWAENDRIRGQASRALTLAANAAGVPRFVQESFAPIYAPAGTRWVDETSAVRVVRYNRTVLDAERAVEEFAAGGESGVVLRFAFFYGDDDSFTRAAFDAVRRGRVPALGCGDAYFSMVHHGDAAAATVAALALPAGIYNVVDDEPLTRQELGNTIAAIAGVAPPRMLPEWLAKLGGSLGEVMSRSLRISNRKLRDAAAWAPRYPTAREGWRAVAEPK